MQTRTMRAAGASAKWRRRTGGWALIALFCQFVRLHPFRPPDDPWDIRMRGVCRMRGRQSFGWTPAWLDKVKRNLGKEGAI